MITIIAAALVVTVVVFVHELGHLVAGWADTRSVNGLWILRTGEPWHDLSRYPAYQKCRRRFQ